MSDDTAVKWARAWKRAARHYRTSLDGSFLMLKAAEIRLARSQAENTALAARLHTSEQTILRLQAELANCRTANREIEAARLLSHNLAGDVEEMVTV